MPVFIAPAPPPLPQDTIQPYASLPPNQEEMYETVSGHFSKENYILPGSEEGKGELMEEEKFWLVSIAHLQPYVWPLECGAPLWGILLTLIQCVYV